MRTTTRTCAGLGILLCLLVAGCAAHYNYRDDIYTASGKYYVFGEVKREGSYDHREGMTLLDAVSAAGIDRENASQYRVRLVCKENYPPMLYDVNLKRIIKQGYKNPPIHENDIVYIRASIGAHVLRFINRLLSPLRNLISGASETTLGGT